MGACRILILALVALIPEIESIKVPVGDHQLRSPYSQYSSVPPAVKQGRIPHKLPQIYYPKKIYRKINPSGYDNYHRKKLMRFVEPMKKTKKTIYPKISIKYPGVPRKLANVYPVGKWNYQGFDAKNPHPPIVHAGPPKFVHENPVEAFENTKNPLNHRPSNEHFQQNRQIGDSKNHQIGALKNHRLESKNSGNEIKEDRPIFSGNHEPEQETKSLFEDESNEREKNEDESPVGALGSSKDRIQFHLSGHAGPETYMFGYDTGNGENRQFRMEERHEDGTVTGHYGYIDARGKLRKVRYKASPTHGYEEKNSETSKQEV